MTGQTGEEDLRRSGYCVGLINDDGNKTYAGQTPSWTTPTSHCQAHSPPYKGACSAADCSSCFAPWTNFWSPKPLCCTMPLSHGKANPSSAFDKIPYYGPVGIKINFGKKAKIYIDHPSVFV